MDISVPQESVDYKLGNLTGRVEILEQGYHELKRTADETRREVQGLHTEVREGNARQAQSLSNLETKVTTLMSVRDIEVEEHKLTRQRNDDRTWSLLVGMIMLGGSVGSGKLPLPPSYQNALTVLCIVGMVLLLGFLSVQRIKR